RSAQAILACHAAAGDAAATAVLRVGGEGCLAAVRAEAVAVTVSAAAVGTTFRRDAEGLLGSFCAARGAARAAVLHVLGQVRLATVGSDLVAVPEVRRRAPGDATPPLHAGTCPVPRASAA